MADRMIIMPPRLTARQSGTTPRLDYVFVYPDVLAGAKVRLIVYDLDLFRQNPLCAAEGPGFARFKRGDQARAVLDPANAHPTFGSELDPLLVSKSGILLKLDGTLLRTQSLPAPQGWYFSKRAEAVENSDKPFSIVRLHMPMDKTDAESRRVNPDAIARIILRDDSFQHQFTDHRLVFRVALTHPHAGIPAGGVVAQSLCPEHNPACPPTPPDNPRNAGVIVLDAGAVQQGKPPRIGGPDDPPAPLSPTPNPRVLPFDLTGFYEHDTPGYPAMILHINQAGYSLVGWFSRPLEFAKLHAPAVPGLPERPGCFNMSNPIVDTSPDKRHLIWWECQEIESSINKLDPDQVKQGTAGSLRRIPRTSTFGDPLDDDVELTFEHSDGSPDTTLPFKKIKSGARWPWFIVNDPEIVPPDDKDRIIAEHIDPVPAAAWEHIRKRLDPRSLALHSPDRTLEWLIKEWHARSSVSGRNGVRETLARYLGAELSPILHPTSHVNKSRAIQASLRVHAYAAHYRIKIGDVDESLLYWLKLMVSQYMTDAAEDSANKGSSVQQIYESIETVFKETHIYPAGQFVYTMKFEQKGTNVWLLKAYAFRVTIKKEVKQADGTLVPDKDWTNKGHDTKRLYGYFVAAGTGLTTGKNKQIRGGAFPSEAVFDTFMDLQLADFNDAQFSIVAFDVAKVNIGPLKGGLLASSMFQFDLKNGAKLTAIAVEDPKLGFTKSKSIGGTLFELSGGFGRITTDSIKKVDPPHDSSDSLLDPSDPDLRAEAHVVFNKDSATVLLDERHHLERRLAIVRAVFETGDPAARALGYTSPEASEAHNDDLSERRAAAVKTAVLDAFPPEMALTRFDVVGCGENPGIIRQGFLDPPGVTAEDRIRIRREETDYNKWRKVDVFVSSLLVVRAAPKDEKKGKGP